MADEPTADAEVEDERIGLLIHDKYKVLRKLGEGGMGAVYEVEHTLIGRRLAIKFLHPDFASSPDIMKRFEREARATTAIGQEHIVEVTDMGILEDNTAFMVLELLEGQDLGDEIRQGPLSVSRVVDIASQVCDAVAAAHDKGIVHRDIKPPNIFLTTRGGERDFVKVLDFGVARSETMSGEASLTQTGAAIGTPQYMAPEQAHGAKGIDHRVDIFALGVVIYEALTGSRPFRGDSNLALMMSICADPAPPMESYRTGLPRALEAVVSTMLEKEPDDRYQSCEEVKAALAPFADMRDEPIRSEGAAGRETPLLVEPFSATEPGREEQPEEASSEGDPEASHGEGEGEDEGADSQQEKESTAPVSASIPPTILGPEAAPPSQKSRWSTRALAAGVLVALVIGGAVVGVLAARGRNESATPEPTEDPAAGTAVPEPEPPEKSVPSVRIQVQTVPPAAELSLDGEPIANPFDAKLPQQHDPQRLVASLEGYQTVSKTLSLRYPQKIRLVLQPAEAPQADAGAGAGKQVGSVAPPGTGRPRTKAPPAPIEPTTPVVPAGQGAPEEPEAPVVEESPPEPPPPPTKTPASGGEEPELMRVTF